MREVRMEPIVRYYCDACKHEIKGNSTVYTFPSGKELNAHTTQTCREIVSNMPEGTDSSNQNVSGVSQ